VRLILVGVLAILGFTCFGLKIVHPFDFIGERSYGWFLDRLLPRLDRLVASWSLPMMLFYPVGLLSILILERIIPAVPSQKTLSTALVFDALWPIVKGLLGFVLVSTYGTMLYRLYVQYLGFLTFPLSDSIPIGARVVIAVLVADLTQWIQHWLHHHVRWLWPFHAVHHSQRELNLFTQYRVHSMEYLVRRPVVLFPMLILGLQAPEVTWWQLITSWHTRLYHANIRSNFGPLRYLIVTPQSHRIHHSLRPEHLNHNYGTIFSFWDYLFGTQCREYETYPETGIDDADFPHESAGSAPQMLLTLGRQLVYPFRQVWAMLGKPVTPPVD
jgi:sterol desaturase/sphingolipid hydroxylase (fatty acid hydroxylase superfamily)